MNHYYLPFDPNADVNYLHLFSLYDVATYRPEKKAFDTIKYQSIPKLSAECGLSQNILYSITKSQKYSHFFTFNSKEKTITLHNSFPKEEKNGPFVCLTSAEVAFLRQHNDNLLCKYLIYTKFYCGLAKKMGKKQDFTAKQFLSACGYSINSQSYIDKVSNYNGLLSKAGFITIEKKRVELGHTRNLYSYLP